MYTVRNQISTVCTLLETFWRIPQHTVRKVLADCPVGWKMEIFLIGQNRSTNQRSGMILPVEVQIQIFGAHAKFSFSKVFQGAQILIFFDENWQGASLYIKEQTQKYKFEI